MPTCDRHQIQLIRDAVHLIRVDICEQKLVCDYDGKRQMTEKN